MSLLNNRRPRLFHWDIPDITSNSLETVPIYTTNSVLAYKHYEKGFSIDAENPKE